MEAEHSPEQFLSEVLDPAETVHVKAKASDAVLAVTNRRLVVVAPPRPALAVPFEGLRRIQFDIERTRPATLVIVPDAARDEPQVLAIPPSEYRAVGDALVALGLALAALESASSEDL